MEVFFFSCAASIAIIGLLLISKLAWRIAVDVPNDRSLHSRPIPRIGGWGVIPAAIAAVTFFGFQRMPFVTGRKRQAVGPVRVVRHQTAARGPPHQRTQRCQSLYFGMFLEVAERGGCLSPTVKAQHRLAEARGGLQ